jgi:two-component system, OmpR family, phosphate regulon response regulator PhoB
VATILIVDDEEPIREMFALILAAAGHRTILAIDGTQALELVAEEQPDLVLSDVMMPVLGGVELCRRLKAGASTGAMPVILMSAAGEDAARGAGANAFIGKPFEPRDLESLLRRWLPPSTGGAPQGGGR